jgi:hypothetical protein
MTVYNQRSVKEKEKMHGRALLLLVRTSLAMCFNSSSRLSSASLWRAASLLEVVGSSATIFISLLNCMPRPAPAHYGTLWLEPCAKAPFKCIPCSTAWTSMPACP